MQPLNAEKSLGIYPVQVNTSGFIDIYSFIYFIGVWEEGFVGDLPPAEVFLLPCCFKAGLEPLGSPLSFTPNPLIFPKIPICFGAGEGVGNQHGRERSRQ